MITTYFTGLCEIMTTKCSELGNHYYLDCSLIPAIPLHSIFLCLGKIPFGDGVCGEEMGWCWGEKELINKYYPGTGHWGADHWLLVKGRSSLRAGLGRIRLQNPKLRKLIR